ncbi:hypothetical protein FUA23_04610 [Neolewinella aurantiaca]|uniref:Uncharacterized protein n=1 Tax=Neolewinella aurantiaca TaxID=2602767 RepID=A0A5C7FZK3_9BACT|nr:hypothetical protein [Neolewinella aurantiaca]TXF90728.1 hypothetical protein FUA23_04610 [Neolewinella aurantiaca]
MPNRLVGIILCVLLANVLNYALGTWLDSQIPNLVPPVAVADGSTLNTSRFFVQQADTVLAGTPDAETLLDFYAYLDEGGTSAYSNWRTARADLKTASAPFRLRALEIADASNSGRFLSLLLLIITLLLFFGRVLKETSLFTPVLYLLIYAGTTILYGSLSAPLFSATVVGSLVVYFGGLRLFLPIYHTEWVRLMRPGLTFCLFLLAVMAWRGPELVDYGFWTSPLFRLCLVLVILLTVFFHLSILKSVLTSAKMNTITQTFAIGMPLGFTLLVAGLFLGFYGKEAGAALGTLNYELVLFPPETVMAFNPEAPFFLSLIGVLLLVMAGIGYFIQKIAR